MTNGFVQHITVEGSTSKQWVKGLNWHHRKFCPFIVVTLIDRGGKHENDRVASPNTVSVHFNMHGLYCHTLAAKLQGREVKLNGIFCLCRQIAFYMRLLLDINN